MSTDRKSFIRNSLLALAATFLPEILRPMDGVVKDEVENNYGIGVEPYYETGNFYFVDNKAKVIFRVQNDGLWKVAHYYSRPK